MILPRLCFPFVHARMPVGCSLAGTCDMLYLTDLAKHVRGGLILPSEDFVEVPLLPKKKQLASILLGKAARSILASTLSCASFKSHTTCTMTS